MRSWALIAGVLLIVILIPFFLFEKEVNSWVERSTRPELRRASIAAAVVLLLGVDVFLPIPSSVVSTTAGATLGFSAGLAASATGMTLGCLLAHLCGRKWGLRLVRRFVRDRDFEVVSDRYRRNAGWALAAMRPVPVLAEASTLFAGVTGMPLPMFLTITTLANIGISAVYCAAGARAVSGSSFLLAFAASLALPGLAMAVSHFLRRRKVQ
jgi:uncharacterized membrane protein YdjX (TVP38/TMEM64 family)